MTKRRNLDGDYAVGHGKPPKSGQFKPGQSGNPKGRPKGAKNVKTVVQEEALLTVTITEGGKQTRVTKMAALIKSLINKGLGGDHKAAARAMDLMQTYLDEVPDDRKAAPALSAEDRKVLDDHASFLAVLDEAEQAEEEENADAS